MTSIFDRDAFNESLFFPRPDVTEPPAGAEDRYCDVGDAQLHIRIHHAHGARCTLLLFHGNGEVVSDYDQAAARFAAIGAALAIADFRGYGASTGTSTLRTAIHDARPIADATPGAPLIVMGRSLGGAAAHELFAHPNDRMAGVVLESAFFELDGLIRRRGLAPPAAYSDEERAAFEPAGKIARGTLPLLVLHGAADDVVVPAEARGAHAAARDAELVFVPGRGHNDLHAGQVYWDALGAFIARVTG